MKLGEIKLSYPLVSYETNITHFTARKSTAIEWVILESISMAQQMNRYLDVPLDTIFKSLFGIADSDLLIKPCLLQLYDLGAVEAPTLYDDVSLTDVLMRDVKLTDVGLEMQRKGLLPGEDREDVIILFYDLFSETLLEGTITKYSTIQSGLSIIDRDEAEESAYPASLIKMFLEGKKARNDKKYPWLQQTTTIKDLIESDRKVIWKNTTKEFELGENGLCTIKNVEKEEVNALLFRDEIIDMINSNGELSSLNRIHIADPEAELKEVFYGSQVITKIREMVNLNVSSIISNEIWSNHVTIEPKTKRVEKSKNKKNKAINHAGIVIIDNAIEFSFRENNDQLIVHSPKRLLPDNCLYMGDSGQVYAGILDIHNSAGNEEIEIGYIPKKVEKNLGLCIMDLVEEHYKEEKTIIVLMNALRNDVLLQEYMYKALENMSSLNDKSEFVVYIEIASKKIFDRRPNLDELKNKVFIDAIAENRVINGIKELTDVINLIKPLKIYEREPHILRNAIKALLEKTMGIESIKKLDGLWRYIISIDASLKNWIKKDGYLKNIYTPTIIENFINGFGTLLSEDIKGHTIIEETFLKLEQTVSRLSATLGDTNINEYCSRNKLVAFIVGNKDKLKDMRRHTDAWEQTLKALEREIGTIDDYIPKDCVFEMCKANIEMVVDIISVFFGENIEHYNNIYVVDTSTLVNKPKVISYFSGNKKDMLVVPTTVLTELDKLKSSDDAEESYKAREVIRQIEQYKTAKWMNLRENSNVELLPRELNNDSNDNLILSVALKYYLKQPTLITDDINFRNIASSQGIQSMDSRSLEDKMNPNKNNSNGNSGNKGNQNGQSNNNNNGKKKKKKKK